MAERKAGWQADFIISLKPAVNRSFTKKANKAVLEVKRFVLKHTRNPNVLLTNEVNEFLWQRGKFHLPKKIAVTLKEDKGKIRVYLKGSKLIEEEAKKKEKERKEKLKAKEEKKKEAKKTREELAAEEEKKKKLEEKRAKEKAAEAVEMKRG